MPRKIFQQFFVEQLSILNGEGSLDASLDPQLSADILKKIYHTMLLTRSFDERAIALQRQGRMGTYASCLGQEAIHAATAAALNAEDWIVPSFREQGVLLQRGVPIKNLFLFFMGSEECHRGWKALKILPHNIPCASQLPHGVGLALAEKLKARKNEAEAQKYPVVATYFGDGATSEGDFHEALNFAAVFQTPNIFICQNNQWAISTPLRQQTHSRSLAQKAITFDMPTLQADGNDVLAVYQATREAAERARSGGGPTLLEFVCYRLGAHTTADDPSRYRQQDEVERWKKDDPLLRFEKYLLDQHVIEATDKNSQLQIIFEEIKNAAQEAEEFCKIFSQEKLGSYLFQKG